jgi:arylsulfatase A-like enzyme
LPFDGGYTMPFIACWPGTLPAGEVVTGMSTNLNFLATCLSVDGVPLPRDRVIEGGDLMPMLRDDAPSPHDLLCSYKGSRLVGVRHGASKYLRPHVTDNGGYASLRQRPFPSDLAIDSDESYSLLESRPDAARQLAGPLDVWDVNVRGWL